MPKYNIQHHGAHVVLAKDGVLIDELPWDKALDIGRALIVMARKAEEVAKATSIIYDQAVMTRAGWPHMGLTAHPKIIEEAGKEAAWNSDLRRYLPGGVKSKETLYPPGVTRAKPTPTQQHADREFWQQQKEKSHG